MGLMKKVLLKLAGINEELEQEYINYGYTDKYIEGFKALHEKKMKPMDYLTLADIYISREMYDEAEEALGNVKIGFTTDDTIKGMYYLEKLNLLVGVEKYEEALEVFKKEQKFLDIFYSAPAYKRMGVAYYDTAVVILAANGDLNAAGYYYQLELQSAEKYDKTGVNPMLTNVHMLKLAGNDDMAAEAAEKAREFIKANDQFRYPWQKDQFLHLIDRYMGVSDNE